MDSKENLTVYSSEGPRRFITSHLWDIAQSLPQAHELGFRLFKRNLKAQYRQSMLGLVWAVLPPLATAALWIFLQGNNVVSMRDTGVPYPIFVLTGTMLWQVFSESISAPINQVTDNRAMLAKINIPREGLLLSGAYELLFNTFIKLVILSAVYLYFHQQVALRSLAIVPVGLFAISAAGFSIGLFLTPLGLLYQDVNRGLAILLPFFMYLTPVVYPVPQDGPLSQAMKFNPLSTLIVQTRNGFISQPVYDLSLFLLILLAFTLFFLICLAVYRIAMPIIIERMGS